MTSLLVTSYMDVRHQQREAIECLRHEGIKQVGIVEVLQKAYRDKALSKFTVCQWLDIFKSSILDDDSDEENITLPCAS